MASTFAGSRLTEAHRLAQLRLGSQTVDQMHTVWPLLDPADLDGTFDRWLRATAPIVGRQRITSSRLAGTYATTFRAIELGRDVEPIVPTLSEVVATERLATSLLVTGPLSIKRAMVRSIPLARAVDVADSTSAAAAMRLALDGGRETLMRTIEKDPLATSWQRVTSGNACDFCSMLEGRGAVYKTDTVDFEAHDHCSCTAEPGY
jgi:hypothetical protein